jgi:HEAT repeat protein
MLFGPAVSGEVPAFIDALDDPRKDVQIKACEALRDIGPGAMAAAPALAGKLASRGPDILIANAAEDALVAIGPAALPSVIRCLEGDDTEARHCAMLVLARFGPAARDAVPALARLVNLPDGAEALTAIAVLAKIGPGASAAIPALSAAYESLGPDDEDRKYELLNALPRIGALPGHHQRPQRPRP